jgi:AbrB family looped-hinge helix DNA binding protein
MGAQFFTPRRMHPQNSLSRSVFRITVSILPLYNNLTSDMLTDFLSHVILLCVNMTEKPETVSFTTKGQVVIPLRLRKQFDIEDGTKAVVQATPDGILLKPMTAALIRRGRGILKRVPGGKPLTEDWSEHKKQERALEGRLAG